MQTLEWYQSSHLILGKKANKCISKKIELFGEAHQQLSLTKGQGQKNKTTLRGCGGLAVSTVTWKQDRVCMFFLVFSCYPPIYYILEIYCIPVVWRTDIYYDRIFVLATEGCWLEDCLSLYIFDGQCLHSKQFWNWYFIVTCTYYVPSYFKGKKWNNRFLKLSLYLNISAGEWCFLSHSAGSYKAHPSASAHWNVKILITFYHTDTLNCLLSPCICCI